MPFKTLRTSVQTVAANDEVTVLFEPGGNRRYKMLHPIFFQRLANSAPAVAVVRKNVKPSCKQI